MRRDPLDTEPDRPGGDLIDLARRIEVGAVVTRGGQVHWANAPAAKVLGIHDPRELVGRAVDSLVDGDASESSPAAPRGRAAEVFRIAPTRDASGDASARGRGTSEPHVGEELWVVRDVESSAAVGGARGAPAHRLDDARRELATVRKQLAVEILERERLLSVVSHELRTPITVIRGYNNLLLADEVGALNEQQQGFLEESNRSCERLNRFVGDLLAACGGPGNTLTVDLRPASLVPVVSGLVTFFRPLLAERSLAIEVDLAEDAVEAEFDAGRIEQVLTNLLTNAIRYSEPGTAVRVRSRRRGGPSHAALEVSVADTGPGVAPENRERVFEPYVRVGDPKSGGGLGLGLAICRRIIRAHGGTIRVDDEPGAGSRFVFKLPLETGCD